MRLLVYILLVIVFGPRDGQTQGHIHNVPESMSAVSTFDNGSLMALANSGNIYTYNGYEYELVQTGLIGATTIEKQGNQTDIPTKNGVWKWSPDHFVFQSLSEQCYSYIDIDQDEYTISSTGMSIYKEGRFQLINDWNISIADNAKFKMLDDQAFLCNDKTIYKFNGQKWKSIASDSLVINDITLFGGDIWVATEAGLHKVVNRKLQQVEIIDLDHAAPTYNLLAIEEVLYFQSEDNLWKWNSSKKHLELIESKSSTSPIVKDAWDDIWYVENGNIIQQKVGDPFDMTPLISAIEIKVNDKICTGTNIIVDKANSDLRIDYLGIFLRQPKDIKYQSLLSPLNDKYGPISSNQNVFYSDLPAGKYTYRLRATIDGSQFAYSDPINMEVKEVKRLSPLWWILGAAIVALLVLAMFFNFRLQLYKDKSSLLSEKLRTTNDLLKSQQKTLQLQMNPHFLFNALNSIQGLVALDRKDEAKLYLQKFSRMMRSVLDFSRDDKIYLQTEIDYLDDYLSIEKMTRDNSFEYEINVQNSLLEEEIKVPPMVLQPFVENAIIHGVSSIRNGKISIEILDEDDYIKCIIVDNGIGREMSSKKKKSTHKSVAVSLAKNRLNTLSKSKHRELIVYKDLPKGTEVVIYIPI